MCEINEEFYNAIMKKMPYNKAPRFDSVTMFWFKKLNACVKPIAKINKEFMERINEIPEWLSTTRTTVIPKNEGTHDTKQLSNEAPWNIVNYCTR